MARQQLAVAVVLALLAVAFAGPITVPVGGPTAPGGDVAIFDSLYPNGEITADECVFEENGEANVVGVHAVAIPGSSDVLFLELPNGNHPLDNDNIPAAIFDALNSSSWRAVVTNQSLYSAGHVPTTDGLLVIAGGNAADNLTYSDVNIPFTEGTETLRLYSPEDARIPETTTMNSSHWKPTLTLLPDGKVMITGGLLAPNLRGRANPTIEVFDPAAPDAELATFQLDDAYVEGTRGKPLYPFTWVLPTGHVFIYGDLKSCVFDPAAGECIKTAGGELLSPPPRPGGIASLYPFSASAVLTKLVPNDANEVTEADIVVFGGSAIADHPDYGNWRDFNLEALATRNSHRLSISWTRTAPDAPWEYSFGNWTTEDMGVPRVNLDATLLPNGDVVLLNGAQRGVGGYPVNRTLSSNSFPAFWASLYQPELDGDRYTLLCGSPIPRAYHGSAVLTTEGTVLVAGADRPDFLPDARVPWFNGTDNVAPYYMTEIFKPPYAFDDASRPTITTINGGTDLPTVTYDADFTVQYEGTVTGAVLVAPSATTQSFNQNQRVVELNFFAETEGEITVTTPLDGNVAPPQHYMLFLLNGKTYSTAKWIKLESGARKL